MSLLGKLMGRAEESDLTAATAISAPPVEYLVKDPGEYGFDTIYRRMPCDERNSLQVYIKEGTIKVVFAKKSIVYLLMKIDQELIRQKGARISPQKIVMKHPKSTSEHKSIDNEVDGQIVSVSELLSTVPEISERLKGYIQGGRR